MYINPYLSYTFIQYVLQARCYFLGVPVGSDLHVPRAHVLYLFTTKVHVVPVSPFTLHGVFILHWIQVLRQ